MSLARRWAGKAYGTHIGNLYVTFDGDEKNLTGTLRFNDSVAGLAVYAVGGSFEGSRLTMTGKPEVTPEGFSLSPLQVIAIVNARGELHGDWQTQSGAGGTLVLFPHDQTGEAATSEAIAAQLHTVRHHFGAIAIDRDDFVALAEEVQQSFKKGKVTVTWMIGTEQTRFLEDFKTIKQFGTESVKAIKFFVQESDENGLNRIVSVEFGPQVNSAMTQGASEAWVLGELEKIRQRIRPYERSYATNFLKRFGIGMNQLLIILALVAAPSFNTFWDRLIFVGGVLAAIVAIWSIHNRFLPFAAIYVTTRPLGLVRRFGPSVFSWLISITGTVLAALIGAYLKGWLRVPTGP